WWNLIDLKALPAIVPMSYVAYLAVTFISNFQVRSRWMLAFPLYGLLQATLMPALGACQYLTLAIRRRQIGRYRFGYRRLRPASVLQIRAWFHHGRTPAPTSALDSWADSMRPAA